jgi:hypothetical protein
MRFGWLRRQDERYWRMEGKRSLTLEEAKGRSQTVGTVQARPLCGKERMLFRHLSGSKSGISGYSGRQLPANPFTP